MNVENIKKLRDRILQPDAAAHFDMKYLFNAVDYNKPFGEAIHDCGTAACLAGWATVLAAPEKHRWEVTVVETASDYLGLNDDDADELFFPPGLDKTIEQAVETLDRLIETGEVIWS